MKIGILTTGGDAPGLNAVIRAATRVAIRQFRWDVIGIEDGFEGLYRPDGRRPLTLSDVRGLLPRGGTILGTTNRGRLVQNGRIVPEAVQETTARIKELGIEALIVIGGDGSLRIAQALYDAGVSIVGVPKTIDNDLDVTDVTFGFDTAVSVATEAVDRLHTTAESHDRVMLVEVMGRDVGWIALHAGMGGGADIILIPEIPFTIEAIARSIRVRDAAGAQFSIIVVAEGCRLPSGEAVYSAPGRLGGVADHIAAALAQQIDKEIRVVVLGHLQRGGSPTACDRVLATRMGAEATMLIARRAFGQMVALRGTEIVSVPIEEAIGHMKHVPADGQIVRAARDLGISFGDPPPRAS